MKTRLSRTYFKKLTAGVGGMLGPDVYRQYYLIAREHSKRSIIELGTGQGASTIAFALGVRDSGRDDKVYAIDQFYQYGAGGPHPAGIKKYGDQAIDINLNSFRENIRKEGVEEYVEILVGKTDEIEIDFSRFPRCDVLAIDVDGYINRDLALFYDHIDAGGLIIVDDYRNTVNRRGRDALRKYSPLRGEGLSEALNALTAHQRGRLLGKHLLTYRFIDLFRRRGLLRPVRVMGATLVCRKTGNRAFNECIDQLDIENIERSIVEDFEGMVSGRIRQRWPVRAMLGELRQRIRRLYPGRDIIG